MEQQTTTPGVTPGVATSEYQLANRASWIGIVLTALGILVESAYAVIEFVSPLAAQLPTAKWLGVVLIVAGIITKVATSVGYTRGRSLVKAAASTPQNAGKALLVLLALGLAAPAFAGEVDPTTSTVDAAGVADQVAQSAPDLRFSIRVGKATLAPAISIAPFAVSLRDGSVTSGFNVGGGYELLWKAGTADARGIAGYALMRSTAEGPRPLLSLLAVPPWLGQYGVRVGLGYQIGGSAAFRDAAVVLVSASMNLGFAAPAR